MGNFNPLNERVIIPDAEARLHIPNNQFKVVGRGYTFFACDICRRKRIRCDGTRPICDLCKRSNRICCYMEIPSISPEKDTENIDKSLIAIKNTLKTLHSVSNISGTVCY
ncbi:Lysine biosynthesis regulatory protein LYS14 [Smittium mucronatum]|uniref:Lysine biosynthesis regulatory protein LYS14 n=1 Tax=Smittium mucronatum TaxID=133383 RepID=A0A1R0GPG5_9FUNG|nr:Lysine biosynthesis regulatory protein LYS14 [Smittium mucronatum]